MKVSQLKAICQKLRPGLDRQKSLIEHFRHICFTGTNIITFNERICVAHPFETEFTCSVMGYDFIDVISNLPQNADIQLRLVKGKLRIRGAGTSIKMSTFDEGALTNAYSEIFKEELLWRSLPVDFMEAIKLCHFSVAKDLTRLYLNYINVSFNNIISSDNLRISKYDLESPIEEEFFIPGVVCRPLLQYPVQTYALFKPWIGFKTAEGVQFFCRTSDVADFPDVSSLFEFEGETFNLPTELKQIVESLAVITEEEFLTDRHMTVTIKDNKVSCFVEKSTVSANRWVETDIDKDITFIINPIFFKEILEQTRTIKISNGKALFTTGKFKHLLSLPIKYIVEEVK